MTGADRERYLRGWATSRLPQRRKAFQALKRLITVTHYTTPGAVAPCRMGADRRTSVVDAEHRVWGIRNLYAADASVFPTALGVNPMLTVMAIAHRAAGIISSHG